jgi:hypothetical protein
VAGARHVPVPEGVRQDTLQDAPQPGPPLRFGLAEELLAPAVGSQERLVGHIGRVDRAVPPRSQAPPGQPAQEIAVAIRRIVTRWRLVVHETPSKGRRRQKGENDSGARHFFSTKWIVVYWTEVNFSVICPAANVK